MVRNAFWIVQRKGAVKVSMELKSAARAKKRRDNKIMVHKAIYKREFAAIEKRLKEKESEKEAAAVRYAIVSDGAQAYIADLFEDRNGYSYKLFNNEVAKTLTRGAKVRVVLENMPHNQYDDIVRMLSSVK